MVHSQHCYWSGGPWTCKSLSGKREKGHSGPKLKSMVLMSQGRKVTYEWHMFLSFFILLVSPWYMYKGSCFRDVCADTVVVGGYFRGSTGVYIYISLSQYISILYHFSGVKWKGYFQWIIYFLERANLTGHFGSSGYWRSTFVSVAFNRRPEHGNSVSNLRCREGLLHWHALNKGR